MRSPVGFAGNSPPPHHRGPRLGGRGDELAGIFSLARRSPIFCSCKIGIPNIPVHSRFLLLQNRHTARPCAYAHAANRNPALKTGLNFAFSTHGAFDGQVRRDFCRAVGTYLRIGWLPFFERPIFAPAKSAYRTSLCICARSEGNASSSKPRNSSLTGILKLLAGWSAGIFSAGEAKARAARELTHQ